MGEALAMRTTGVSVTFGRHMYITDAVYGTEMLLLSDH